MIEEWMTKPLADVLGGTDKAARFLLVHITDVLPAAVYRHFLTALSIRPPVVDRAFLNHPHSQDAVQHLLQYDFLQQPGMFLQLVNALRSNSVQKKSYIRPITKYVKEHMLPKFKTGI